MPQQPKWLETAVFYQVLPQSYQDSNGDGIGDIPGITSRLDYIKSIGCNVVWLNPIFDSPMQDAGYDVRDFFKVAPRYGTNEDLIELFEQAHKRDMRVVIDLIPGHTSVEHAWFKEACKAEKNKCSDYYVFTGEDEVEPLFGEGILKSEGGRPGNVAVNFFPFQPALDYGYANPDPEKPWQVPPEHPKCLATRHQFRDVMEFWLKAGVDGFRIDMASSLIKGDADQGYAASKRFWQGFRAWMDRDWPEAVLVSEWSEPEHSIGAGFHVDFLIHYGAVAYQHLVGPFNSVEDGKRTPHIFFEAAGEGDIVLFTRDYQKHYDATVGKGYISMPTGNHDYQRPKNGRELGELRTLYTMLLTMPGVPLIYYGDEIAMRNVDEAPDIEGAIWRSPNRTPMQWEKDKKNFGFSEAEADKLYLPVDPHEGAPTVDQQEADSGSTLNFVRELLSLRAQHPALGNDGAYRTLYAKKGQYPFIYERSSGNQRIIVVVNPARASMTAEYKLDAWEDVTPLISHGVTFSETEVACEGYAYAVVALK